MSASRCCIRPPRRRAQPQLREMGTVGEPVPAGAMLVLPHPDLTCWLRGGDTCYAQVGDHRNTVWSRATASRSAPPATWPRRCWRWTRRSRPADRPQGIAAVDLYRKASDDDRSTWQLAPGEFVTAFLCGAPLTRARTSGRRAARLELRAGRRRGRPLRRRAAAGRDGGSRNLPRLLDPADPLAGLPGLEQTAWKRRLLSGLAGHALSRVSSGERRRISVASTPSAPITSRSTLG